MLQKETENYLVFTDLDGTLLDHKTYSFEKAKEMLDYLKLNNIPLIIVTSKTKYEILKLRKELQISYPFIVENGAGIFLPKGNDFEQINMGKTYSELLSFLNEYKETFNIKSFSDMDKKEISLLTKLNIEDAKLAKKRDFCEPFIIKDESKIKVLKKLCLKEGFDIVKGGRFYHLITLGQDKANALLKLQKIYEDTFDKKYKTIALGDGENDKTMLACADISILIKKFDGTFLNYEKKGLIKTKQIGPEGWNEALKEILYK
ncbi:mannosyl-3-phosphoglycerate phosphatase [Arcobacter sp. LA11]|uniref:HAD-IIB family hydrolase n=1 Tax=Arcobacter sp. LA11 TaxID=1898176 RepID=UPI000934E798|nr:HAD-IIB family hydrolase [Arcobacter sp. LA11]